MVKGIAIALLIALGFIVLPAPSIEGEWCEFNSIAYDEHVEAFDALFNSYETKWSKNNRLMIRQGNSGSFKFVAKGK